MNIQEYLDDIDDIDGNVRPIPYVDVKPEKELLNGGTLDMSRIHLQIKYFFIRKYNSCFHFLKKMI